MTLLEALRKSMEGHSVISETMKVYSPDMLQVTMMGEHAASFYTCGMTSEEKRANWNIIGLHEAKPPIGLCPRKLWLEQRLQDVKEAIKRYQTVNLPVPEKWAKEYSSLLTDLSLEERN